MRRLLLAALAVIAATAAGAEPPKVVTDILPVQSLVARVAGDLIAPGVIVRPGLSPHDYAFRPSDAAMLAEAEVVFLIGPALTPWLTEPLHNLAPGAYVIALGEVPGTPMALPREGETAGTIVDPHSWLNPAAARVWLPVIADVLAERDAHNAALYRANAEAAVAELTALEADIAARMRPLAARGFLVFHDGYRHFTTRFPLRDLGSIQLSDATRPGAGHFAALRARVEAGQVVCVFTEPQFSPRLAERLVEGTGVRTGVLDPLGARIPPGPGLYPALLLGLAASFETCLAP